MAGDASRATVVLQWRLSPDTPLPKPTADGSTDLGGALEHFASVRRKEEELTARVVVVLDEMQQGPPARMQIFIKTLTVRRKSCRLPACAACTTE